MTIIIYSLAIIGGILLYLPISKIYRHEDINAYDVGMVATFVYFVLIPVYYYNCNIDYAVNLLTVKNGWLTLIYVDLFLSILYGLNKKLTLSRGYKESLLNFSSLMRNIYIDTNFVSKPFIILSCISITFLLVVNFTMSNVQGKNLSNADMEEKYTDVQTTEDRVNGKISGICSLFLIPSMLYGIIILKKDKKNKSNKLLGFYLLSVSILVLIMGSRRPMISSISLLLLFLYSISEIRISFKIYAKLIILFTFIIVFFFPLYQVYRLQKESALLEYDKVDVIFIIQNMSDILKYSDAFNEAADDNKIRSMGLFFALNESIRNNKYNGWVFYKCITNVMPGAPALEDNVEFRLANQYAHRGADIADSIIMYGVADFGIIGLLFCIIYYKILCAFYIFYERHFRLNNFNYIFTIIFLYKIYDLFISVENSAFWIFKSLIFDTIFKCIIIAIILHVICYRNNSKFYLS